MESLFDQEVNLSCRDCHTEWIGKAHSTCPICQLRALKDQIQEALEIIDSNPINGRISFDYQFSLKSLRESVKCLDKI